MKQTRTFVGIARCRRCGMEFPMRSGIHIYCTPKCRPEPRRESGPRTFTCSDCGIEGVAGKRGPLPFRCPDCKQKWDRRPARAQRKRDDSRHRRRRTKIKENND